MTGIINLNQTWEEKAGTTQTNDIDCAVHLLIHAYVWMFHTNPEDFEWQRLAQPTIANTFRLFITNCIRTQHVPNIFRRVTFAPQISTHTTEYIPKNTTDTDKRDQNHARRPHRTKTRKKTLLRRKAAQKTRENIKAHK